MTRPLAVVIGLGRSGMSCARVLDAEGFRVRVVDRADGPRLRGAAVELPAGVEVVLGGYDVDALAGAAVVCPSPGVPWDGPELQAARAAGVPVRSEMEMVFERCTAPIVGITGTNGKTTTTALTGEVIAAGGGRVHVGGNIGATMLDRLGEVRPDDWVVLELSSFQIESIVRPRCRLAAVLNVTPDHIDRHGSLQAYAATKARLVTEADPAGAVVLGYDDPLTRAMAATAGARVLSFGMDTAGRDGATVAGGEVVTTEDGVSRPVLPVEDIRLFGAHNVLNVLAAVVLGRAADVPTDAIARAVRGFRPVPHRLEPVVERDGVLWVDDSKATNSDAAIVALRSFDGRPLIWIGGGGSKGGAPDALASAVAAGARHAVLNGATAGELDAALAARGFAARTVVPALADAVRAAAALARPGDVVLLAPGYTSFDQFESYEQRGDEFARLVRATLPRAC